MFIDLHLLQQQVQLTHSQKFTVAVSKNVESGIEVFGPVSRNHGQVDWRQWENFGGSDTGVDIGRFNKNALVCIVKGKGSEFEIQFVANDKFGCLQRVLHHDSSILEDLSLENGFFLLLRKAKHHEFLAIEDIRDNIGLVNFDALEPL